MKTTLALPCSDGIANCNGALTCGAVAEEAAGRRLHVRLGVQLRVLLGLLPVPLGELCTCGYEGVSGCVFEKGQRKKWVLVGSGGTFA